MQSSLGIYIGNNIIKYAKLLKENGKITIENTGEKVFQDNLEEKINEIIYETNSLNSFICINARNVIIEKFEVSALISKKDEEKAVDIEIESFCNKNKINNNVYYKYISNIKNKDKNEIIYFINNESPEPKLKKTKSVSPICTSICNLIKNKRNYFVINYEEKIEITTVINGCIYQIDILNYELDKAAEKIREILMNCSNSIECIYFTGSEFENEHLKMYFEERLNEIKFYDLVPYFLEKNDYLQMNAPIAIALNGFENRNPINFLDNRMSFTKLLTSDVSIENFRIFFKDLFRNIKNDFTTKLSCIEKLLIRIIIVCLIFIVMYVICGNYILQASCNKKLDLQHKIEDTQAELNEIQADIDIVTKQNEKYEKVINAVYSNDEENKDKITIFLNNINNILTPDLKIIYINNAEENHIVLKIQSEKYESLGYFKEMLSNKNVLKNVKLTNSNSESEKIEVIIEGDLQ